MLETQEARVQSLGQEDPVEEGMAAHSSILAWRIPCTEGSGGLHSMGLQRAGHSWSDLAHALVHITVKQPARSWRLLVSFESLCLILMTSGPLQQTVRAEG